MGHWDAKDPDDIADYWFDFGGVLSAGATILDHEIVHILPDGDVAVDQEEHTANEVRVRLSGGENDVAYDVRCKITTTTGETFYATQVLPVEERKQ
jgi:hypothetical protein